MGEVSMKYQICNELYQEIGGQVLNQHPDVFMQELSSIDQHLDDKQRINEKRTELMENHEGQRYISLSAMYESLNENERKLRDKIENIKCETDQQNNQLKKIGKNNRKNNGKLLDAKVKLFKAQCQRKLLTKLHNIDDGSLDEDICKENQQMEELNAQLDLLKSQVEKLKQRYCDLVSETRADELNLENESALLKSVLLERDQLEGPKCCLLRELRDLLLTLAEAQPKVLELECQQEAQSFMAAQLRAKLTRMQNDLSDKNSNYNSLCCKYQQELQSLLQKQAARNQVKQEIIQITDEIKKCIRVVQDLESKTKCLYRKLQDKSCSGSTQHKKKAQKC